MLNAARVTLDAQRLTLSSGGTGAWSTSLRWQFLNQAEFVNAGTFEILDPTGVPNVDVMQGSGTVRNLGTLRANTTSTAGVDIDGGFFNEGTVELQGGVFRTKGTSSGTLTGAVGTSFLLRDFTLTSSSSLETGGAVNFNGGVNTISGMYRAGELTKFQANVTFLQTPLDLGDAVEVSAHGITVDLGGVSQSLESLTLQAVATLISTGALTTNSFEWSQGTLDGRGTGSMTISQSWVIDVGASILLDGQSVLLSGSSTTNFVSGRLTLDRESSVENRGTFEARSNGGFQFGGHGSPPTFLNSGLFRTVSRDGFGFSGVQFNNTGTVEITSGTFSISAGDNLGGTFSAGVGATLVINGNGAPVTTNIAGAGSVRLNGVVPLQGTFNVTGEVFVGGQLTFSQTPISLGTALTLEGNGASVDLAGASASSGLRFGVAEVVRLQKSPNSHEFGYPRFKL